MILAFENCTSAQVLVWPKGWKILLNSVKIQIRIIALESSLGSGFVLGELSMCHP